MGDRESILNDNELFADTADTAKEGTQQHRKQERLKAATNNGMVFSQGGKKQWIHESVDKARVKSIIKAHTEYKQLELNENGEMLWTSM